MPLRTAAASLLGLLAAATLAAQAPRFQNARLAPPPAGATLAGALRARAPQPRWVGYTVPGLPSRQDECGVVYLEPAPRPAVRAVAAEPLFVMIRIGHGVPGRVRTFRPGCRLDAGGLAVTWLGAVAPAASAAALCALARQGGERGNGALAALGQSSGGEAVNALIQLAQDAASPRLRGQALFWLAQRAGRRAEAAITDAIRNDPVTAVKERAVFGLSQLPPAQGVPLLIQVAKDNPNPAVRARAMFWLGQSRDPRALAFFQHILVP
jgi:hypothetical protein